MPARDEWEGRWLGRTVVCIASGPSLTEQDAERVRASGHPTIVTNTTFRLCPWADALMAFDCRWWQVHSREVRETFPGRTLTFCPKGAAARWGVQTTLHKEKAWFDSYGNSGTAAISLAIVAGASKVVMLGYDCQKTGGRTHWHGDHPRTLGNAHSMPGWPKLFAKVAKFAEARRVPVVNATRETALTCFPRVDLEAALQ